MAVITVVSNGRPVELPEGATVTDLLTALQLGGKWVLVERNGEPVERRLLDRTVLAHGDRLELVRAVSGRVTFPGLEERRLYLCTPDRPDLEPFLAACIRGGVDLVQLRDKELEARAVLARARLALRVCRGLGVPFILNDRPDLALEVGADGVHVGQDDAPPALARRLLGDEAVVGLSTHAPAELDAATAEPVDYVSAGPVVPTPTKPGRPGTGPGYVRYAAGAARMPWFVTGGATPETVGPLVEAGARRFVVVRWLTESSDPGGAARALRRAVDEAISRIPAPG